jgi:hypothetical protein
MQDRVMILMHCTSTHWDISTYKVSCWYLLYFYSYVLDNIFLKGEIIQKWGLTELWFFCTAPLLNEIYLFTMFHLDISYSFRVMFWTKFKVLELTKGNNSKIRTKGVIVLMNCTSTHWDLFTYKVSCWYLL